MGFVWGLFQIKMVSLFYDALYMLCGLIAIIIGVRITNQSDVTTYTQAGTNGIGTALVIFGCVIFLVSIVGSFAVIKDNRKALLAFGVALGVLIVLKIFVASVVLYYLSDATKSSTQQVKDIFNNAPENIRAVDYIQQTYECCGVLGMNYWADAILPPSCCAITTDKDAQCTSTNAYPIGCAERVGSVVEGVGTTIALLLFGISFFEVAGLIISLCLQNTWKNEKRRDEIESYHSPMPHSDDYS